jgi:hypothetical protein
MSVDFYAFSDFPGVHPTASEFTYNYNASVVGRRIVGYNMLYLDKYKNRQITATLAEMIKALCFKKKR